MNPNWLKVVKHNSSMCVHSCSINVCALVQHSHSLPYICVSLYRDDKVLAVSSLNFDPAVSTAAELMYQGRMPSGSQIK